MCAYILRERETDRQTDRQTDRERQRETGRETETQRESAMMVINHVVKIAVRVLLPLFVCFMNGGVNLCFVSATNCYNTFFSP